MKILIVSLIEPGPSPPITGLESDDRSAQTQPTVDSQSKDQWKEVTKSLTSLALSSHGLIQEDEDTSQVASEVNNNNESKEMIRTEKGKSIVLMDKIIQEQESDDMKVNC